MNHEGKQIVIGRSRDCDLVISDKSISRKHASFIFRKDKWWVIDGHGKDKSINGVWKKVDKVFLPVVKHEESKL